MLNPRYLAYCRMMGFPDDPEGMMAHDEIEWPGGKMTGFILWINEMWREWNTLNNYPQREPHGDAQHKAFDVWLNDKNQS